MKQILNKLKRNPKKVFLIDALGALLSFFSFIFVLNPLETYFGLPTSTLIVLSVIALGLFFYSFNCFKLIKLNWIPYLKIIIILNSIYTMFSIGLIFFHFNELTFLGVSYFVIEIVVIMLILIVEQKTYSYQKKQVIG
jgi:hypothetical protein